MVEAMLRRELLPWTLLGLTLGLVEGATAAVLVKMRFADAAAPWAVNLAVAFVSGAPALSNVLSFVWANLAHGRARVRIMVVMMAAFAVTVGLLGLAPEASGGLMLTVLSVLAARAIWSGLLTVRASVWLANYPRPVLARMTGRITVASSLTIAASAALTALTVGSTSVDPRWLYAGAALAGLAAAWLYRRMRVRREHQLLRAEAAAIDGSRAFSLTHLLEILRSDPEYREYMLWMGIYGAGSLMLTSQLVVILTEQLGVPGATQIAMLALVPLLALPMFVPVWARFFDSRHIVEYRARQGWVLVAAMAVMVVAVLSGWTPLLWVGAALLGAAYAGANLGWSLGHQDFAGPGMAQQYMGVHVTLTGVRGMIAPPLGMLAYQGLETAQPGLGRWSVVLPLIAAATGACGFTLMKRRKLRMAR
jgi:MFS family permease